MDPNANNLYVYDEAREKEIWDKCIFVFDSSALLDFYSMSKAARENIYSKVLTPHKYRFWIPGHVQYEFLKNRENVIGKLIKEKYEPLKDNNLKKVEDGLKQIENQIIDLQNKVKSSDTHPHFEVTEIEVFKSKIAEFKRDSEDLTKAVNDRIDVAVNEINALLDNDDILAAFQKTFNVGRDYSFQEVYKITKEGVHRYQFKIPPGYKDLENADKIGTQIFGDLIIWKQLLEYNKEVKKPILFICNDLKEDWCHLDKQSGGEKRISMPREELIREMYDFTGSAFWMYNLSQFLHLANKYWKTEIKESDIKNVAETITTRNQPKIKLDLVYKGGSRSPSGYSNKNPIEIEDGRTIINIGAGVKPIIHWVVDWLLELRIYNNSSYPAFDVKLESIGQSHFVYLEELRQINNIKPLEFITLKATFNQQIESVHTEADELMTYKIPQALEGLLLKITYFDEGGFQYKSYMEIENGSVKNF